MLWTSARRTHACLFATVALFLAGCDASSPGGEADASDDVRSRPVRDAGVDITHRADTPSDARVDLGVNDTALSVCGDGVVGEDETCDGSAPVSGCGLGQACAEDCTACDTAAPACGDGMVSGGERCDASASATGCSPGSACDDTCSACEPTSEPACGDGAVNGDEVCDLSAVNNGCEDGFQCAITCDACNAIRPPICGDGVVNGDELCDASATAATGCDAPLVCAVNCDACEPATAVRCGDGAINGDEVCDASAIGATGCDAPDVCANDCSACTPPAPRCGDGAVNGDEVCDASAGPGTCGEGEVCTIDCTVCEEVPATCGDGVVGEGEACDGALGCVAGDACALDCSACLPAACGDGAVGPDERCDRSAVESGCALGTACTPDCSACTQCGNRVLDPGELCDHDGILGDMGTCTEDEVCDDACGCVPRTLEIVSAVGSRAAIPGTFTADVVVHDESGFSSFALVFLDSSGAIVDAYQSTKDILVQARRVPDDNPTDYVWHFTVHMVFGFDELTYRWVQLVLFGEDGLPSNAVFWDASTLFTAPGLGAECDPEDVIDWCETGLVCNASSGTCARAPAVFSLDGFDGIDVDAGALFELVIADGTGGFLPYWQLFYELSDGIYTRFMPFDDGGLEMSPGVWSVFTSVPSVATALGVGWVELIAAQAVAFDHNDWAAGPVVEF